MLSDRQNSRSDFCWWYACNSTCKTMAQFLYLYVLLGYLAQKSFLFDCVVTWIQRKILFFKNFRTVPQLRIWAKFGRFSMVLSKITRIFSTYYNYRTSLVSSNFYFAYSKFSNIYRTGSVIIVEKFRIILLWIIENLSNYPQFRNNSGIIQKLNFSMLFEEKSTLYFLEFFFKIIDCLFFYQRVLSYGVILGTSRKDRENWHTLIQCSDFLHQFLFDQNKKLTDRKT